MCASYSYFVCSRDRKKKRVARRLGPTITRSRPLRRAQCLRPHSRLSLALVSYVAYCYEYIFMLIIILLINFVLFFFFFFFFLEHALRPQEHPARHLLALHGTCAYICFCFVFVNTCLLLCLYEPSCACVCVCVSACVHMLVRACVLRACLHVHACMRACACVHVRVLVRAGCACACDV